MGSGYELANPRLGKPLRTYRCRALKFLEPGHQNLQFLFCFAVLLVIFDHSFTSITPWVRASDSRVLVKNSIHLNQSVSITSLVDQVMLSVLTRLSGEMSVHEDSGSCKFRTFCNSIDAIQLKKMRSSSPDCSHPENLDTIHSEMLSPSVDTGMKKRRQLPR